MWHAYLSLILHLGRPIMGVLRVHPSTRQDRFPGHADPIDDAHTVRYIPGDRLVSPTANLI
jgi:hypothetical protein